MSWHGNKNQLDATGIHHTEFNNMKNTKSKQKMAHKSCQVHGEGKNK